MDAPKLLIVEDEFLIRMTLAEALADEGFEVVQAETADEALSLLRSQNDLALLLTDVQLPGGTDGMQLAAAARLHRPDIPVIFMTGRPDRIRPGITSPRDAVIAKPYLPSEICQTARRLTNF